MLTNYQVLAITAYTIPTILQAFGLFLLIVTKFVDENLTQRFYFITLSFSECLVSAFGALRWIMYPYEYPGKMIRIFFGYALMYEVMIALTLDRFLKIFLNIKYPLYWKNSHTVKLIVALFVLNGLLCFIIWIANPTMKTLDTYFYLPFDTVFLIVAIGTYGYIFVKIMNNRKVATSELPANNQVETSQPQSSTTPNQRYVMIHKQFLSTFLLVITFSIFTVVPDFVYLYYGLNDEYKDLQEWTGALLTAFYSTSFICDFLIYTFSSKPIRKKLKKWARLGRANTL